MRIVIQHLSGSEAGRRDVFSDKAKLTVGRDASCDVCFDNQKDLEVSGRHFELVPTKGQVEIVDLHSTNGTWVNGQDAERAFLETGDIIELGNGGPRLRIALKRGFWKDLKGWFFKNRKPRRIRLRDPGDDTVLRTTDIRVEKDDREIRGTGS